MPETFKVLTYNIHRGLSAIKRRENLSQIVLALELSQADIVCLQEVWRHDGVDEHQLEALCHARWRHRLWRPTAVFPSGSQGNAVLTRFAVVAWDNINISVGGREPRGFLHVRLQSDSGAVVEVVCTHFGLGRRERCSQALNLRQFLDRHIDPVCPLVLAGDFNEWRGHADGMVGGGSGLREAIWEATGRFGRTFPSFLPLLPLDRIYFRNLVLLRATVIKRLPPVTTMSDHLPLAAVFQL